MEEEVRKLSLFWKLCVILPSEWTETEIKRVRNVMIDALTLNVKLPEGRLADTSIPGDYYRTIVPYKTGYCLYGNLPDSLPTTVFRSNKFPQQLHADSRYQKTAKGTMIVNPTVIDYRFSTWYESKGDKLGQEPVVTRLYETIKCAHDHYLVVKQHCNSPLTLLEQTRATV